MTQIFSTKSNTLDILQQKLKFSFIEKLFSFTSEEWNSNPCKIITYIQKNFGPTIVVRSSAIGEDSFDSSQAGTYSSFLEIPSKSPQKITKAVNSVIKSYKQKENFNPLNQILIQNQTTDVIISGVIFSRTSHLGSPYYVINYEEGDSTTGVTHGVVNNTLKISRNISLKKLSLKWKLLIKSVKEIEKFVENTSLDIEFGIKKNYQIVIFQVRPLTSIQKCHFSDDDISQLIQKSMKQFCKLQSSKKLLGTSTIFSDMSDWNPSEIIGANPNPLDYSLYDYLVMKDAWHKGRKKIGYQKINSSLMIKFGNKPYVDLRSSFNSLIPKNIPIKLKKKLVAYYLDQIKNNQHLHDKIEFEIIFSCYDFIIKSRLKKLKTVGFSSNEITYLHNELLRFTNDVISDFDIISKNIESCINNLTETRKKISIEIGSGYVSNKKLLNFVSILLKDCKINGTIPFSTIARIAFMSSILLKTLLIKANVSAAHYDEFLNSISTPLSAIQKDLMLYSTGKMSKKSFLSKYGHLRPGTYDITAIRYDMNNKFFEDMKFHNLKQKHSGNFSDNKKIVSMINNSELNLKSDFFFDFVKKSLELRELLKFEFTKNLSLTLEIIAKIGSNLGLIRNDLAFLELSQILSTPNQNNLKKSWVKTIELNKTKHEKNNLLILPQLLLSSNDFELIQYFKSKPNFITTKKIKGNIIKLDKKHIQNTSLKNKIILIENADPGFDWIFTQNPLGLITKYGGVASHMSIRCAEQGLPAAIGCGEMIFEQLTSSSKILLDCNSNEILILENQKTTEEIEVKKVLKSLGYIK